MKKIAIIAIVLMAAAPSKVQSQSVLSDGSPAFLSLDDERAKGNLKNLLGTTSLAICNTISDCKQIGIADEKNIIHWSEDVTIEDLEKIIQWQHDFTQFQVNRYRDTLDKPK